MQNLNDYIDRKGLSNPLGDGSKSSGQIPPLPPTYQPDPGFNLPPPGHQQFPPPGAPGFMPPGTGYQPVFIVPNQPNGFNGGMPVY